MERTIDAGASWKPTTATGPTGVRALQNITIEGTDIASMVGQSAADCSPMFVRTYVAGDNYAEYPADLAGAWFVQPLNRAIVHSPIGDVTAPCATVLVLATHDGNRAAALCDDQVIHLTADAGLSWPVPASVPGAMNVTPSSAGYLVASVGAPECVGVQLLTLPETFVEATTVASPSGCLPDNRHTRFPGWQYRVVGGCWHRVVMGWRYIGEVRRWWHHVVAILEIHRRESRRRSSNNFQLRVNPERQEMS